MNSHKTDSHLLTIASQSFSESNPLTIQCFVMAFVSAYRCGAVPDSHRLPSCRDHIMLWSTSNGGQDIDTLFEKQGNSFGQSKRII